VSLTPEMSPLEGLEDAPIYEYKSIRNLQESVDLQSAALIDGRTNQQYLVFMGVRKDDLEKIDHKRASHYADNNLLVIKLMPSRKHKGAHLTLAEKLKLRVIVGMGLPEDCLYPVGATRYKRPRSSKEGDTAYCPSRPENWRLTGQGVPDLSRRLYYKRALSHDIKQSAMSH